MIHRQNWLDTKDWLAYLECTHNLDSSTLNRYQVYLRHLLTWADEHPFPNVGKIKNPFPVYLLTARRDGKAQKLGYSTTIKTLATARNFLNFAVREWDRYRPIKANWIETLYPHKLSKPEPSLIEREYYTLEEVRAMLAVPAETLREQRAQAAIALLFLSGMRVSALASLPIQALDLANLRVLQLPSLGVLTKNKKSAITSLLDIPDLLHAVQIWDEFIKSKNYKPNALWLAPLKHDNSDIYEVTHVHQNRRSMVSKDVQILCKKANIPYQKIHNFRHGHIVYARSLASTPEQIKAISENVMHETTEITDKTYAKLKPDLLHNIITSLGNNSINTTLNQVTDKLTKKEILSMLDTIRNSLE